MIANATTIDCISLDKRAIIRIHDNKLGVVNIALCNKEGGIYSPSEYEPVKKSEAGIVGIMQRGFTL